ncbi:hypothetical protein LTR78_005303 [Recurvomyces mirabilis]|uniref:N-alpha-acetyltransferase 40 n=1 Tax=Recurvomyces mirabilis TaxID=574656 RepID=A0AAE0WNP5_9PEZI|nr:hypothetical protein LTR78_005303 [Recurvomyces mirabilis]KAK5157853.1 hypothetical protein LTS14_003775 [Recurvomyces mirabilis]
MAKRRQEEAPKAEVTGSPNHDSNRPSKKQKAGEKELIKSLNALQVAGLEGQHFDPAWLHYVPQPRTIAQPILSPHPEQRSYTITLISASQLLTSEVTACFDVISSTSKTDYENSTFGWHPKRKLKEMRENEMRYLLVRSQAPSSAASTTSPPTTNQETAARTEPIEAFVSFMATHDSDPPVPVLYIYEIHLLPHLRKIGLGAHLMHIVESVAESMGVRKVMLTCFLSNEKALAFYKRRGYVKDICSPGPRKTRGRVVEPDYVIMSRDVPSAKKTEDEDQA